MSTLPPRPSLKQLKKQAKELLAAHRDGDAEAAARLRIKLPRLSEVTDPELKGAEVSLQEAQHVLACEYGLKSWAVLQAVVKPDFDLLAKAEDRALQVLLHAVVRGIPTNGTSNWDLVQAMTGASSETRERLLGVLSVRQRQVMETELQLAGELATSEVEAAQRRVMLATAELAIAGELRWPSGNGAPALEQQVVRTDAAGQEPSVRLLELLQRPFENLDRQQIAEVCQLLAEQVDLAGMPSLQSLVDRISSPLIREGVCAAVDGTSPALIEDLLATRGRHSLLPVTEKRGRMVIEGVFSILCGDSPTILRYKLEAMYLAEDTGAAEPLPAMTAGQIGERLRTTPASRMSFPEVARVLAEMGALARREGLRSLTPLIDQVVDYPLLRRSLELLVTLDDPNADEETRRRADAFLDAIEWQLHDEIAEDELRYQVVAEGFAALQAGESPKQVSRIAREEAEAKVRRRYAGRADDSAAAGEPTTDGRLLHQVEVFSGLSPSQIQALTAASESRELSAGTVLVEAGAVLEAMHVLVDGQLAAAGTDDSPQRLLDPVSSIGERGLLADQPASATVEAVVPSRVLTIGRDDLARLLEQDADLRFHMRTRSGVRTLVTTALSQLRTEPG